MGEVVDGIKETERDFSDALLRHPIGPQTAIGAMCSVLLYCIAIEMSDEDIERLFSVSLRECRRSDDAAQRQEKAVQ